MKGFVKLLNVWAFNSADVIITNSKLLNSFVKEFFKQENNNIIAINNGIEIQKLKKTKNDSRVIHLGTVGKDTPVKNMDLFIDLALKLLTKYENFHFHLCGRDLGEDSRFFKMIPKKYQHYFIFHGEVDDPNSIYQILDIYVSTSRSEGSPNTILEAMVCGLPVVATDVGGVRELIEHEKTGFLVPSGDIVGLEKYCKILTNNPDLRSQMGQNGKDFIKGNYSSEKMVREFEEIFRSTLKMQHNG
jgi:glycosyltransferase involved in cell wall biosynthesis